MKRKKIKLKIKYNLKNTKRTVMKKFWLAIGGKKKKKKNEEYVHKQCHINIYKYPKRKKKNFNFSNIWYSNKIIQTI
ncbi:hypothetical protein PFAG_04085 [Plasmodium falciparum Santa Lucia]|uniref:Uncharacterized protein n=1 Tax=Plasmodium falciparum Santa Lucia TaxID=478859 RepID=W7G173_PLAFA|nr:hypothetical protein PFAG_04085 [Plasmodium falciparum Santa Lucia]